MDATPAEVEAAREEREAARDKRQNEIHQLIVGDGKTPGLAENVREIKRDTTELKARVSAVEASCATIPLLPCGQHKADLEDHDCRLGKMEGLSAKAWGWVASAAIFAAVASIIAFIFKGM